MATRQVVRVFSSKNPNTTVGEVPLPHVFLAPIRNDTVNFVFYNLNKNRRQAYAVNKDAGMLYNAESWGTGRAVSRIPRVGGSGTHRSGQGAFGNMCRGGRMFNPTTTWRRWHRKVNLTQRRHAVASAVAASAVPSLVLARGHRVNQVAEVPLVVDSLAFERTSDLIAILERLGLKAELDKVRETRKVRAGQGKYRNRRYKSRKGPLIVFSNEDRLVAQSSRNIPGVDVCHIDRLNLLQLAPGGHLGRLIVWTRPAFERLNHVFGTLTTPGVGKKGYVLERPLLQNANLARLVNSNEVQSVVRPKQRNTQLHDRQKRNPLRNKAKMNFLNPYDKERRAAETKAAADNKANRADRRKKRAAARKTVRKHGRAFISNFRKGLQGANTQTEQDYKDYIKSTKIGKDALK
jgi:large subunit ribosomal protein L4e